jgi:hypothetical protein
LSIGVKWNFDGHLEMVDPKIVLGVNDLQSQFPEIAAVQKVCNDESITGQSGVSPIKERSLV